MSTPYTRFEHALRLAYEERTRQDTLKAAGKFTHTAADDGIPDSDPELSDVLLPAYSTARFYNERSPNRTTILLEEVCEVWEAAERGESPLDELVQVAAVALAWASRYL